MGASRDAAIAAGLEDAYNNGDWDPGNGWASGVDPYYDPPYVPPTGTVTPPTTGGTVTPPAGTTTTPPVAGTTTPPAGDTTPPPATGLIGTAGQGGTTPPVTTPPTGGTTVTPPVVDTPVVTPPVGDTTGTPPAAGTTPVTTAGTPTFPTPSPTTVASVTAPTNVARTIGDKETVAGQLNDLLHADSKYMQSAKANAMVQANSRGLINSSMAVGAGQKAAIDSALPIAQQDATINANAGQLAQQGNQDINLTGYNSLLGSAQAKENAGYRKEENEQNIQANKDLKTMDAENNAALRKQADDATYKLEMDRLAKTMEFDLTKLDRGTQDRMVESFGTLSQQRLDTIKGINMTPTAQLSEQDKIRMIDQINQDFDAQAQTMFAISGYTYKSNWAPTTTPGTTPGTTPATGGTQLERYNADLKTRQDEAINSPFMKAYNWAPWNEADPEPAGYRKEFVNNTWIIMPIGGWGGVGAGA